MVASIEQKSAVETAIEQEIIEIVANKLKIKKDSISPESRFVEDLKADSLDTVEIMMEIEGNYKYDIPDEDAAQIKTVSDIVKYIMKKQEELK